MIYKEKTRWCEKEGTSTCTVMFLNRMSLQQFGNFCLVETSLATSNDNRAIGDVQDKGLEPRASKAISNKAFI